MKKLLTILILIIPIFLMAQPPIPGQTSGGSGTTASPNSSKGINRTSSSPIGTATLLMMTMGGAFLGYKVKKSKKDKNN